MKIRSGFVSNSSSASFVVKWRRVDVVDDGEDNVFRGVCDLFDLSYYLLNEDKTGFNDDKDKIFCSEKEAVQKIIANTIYRNGRFITSDWTSMMNSYFDFSPEIGSLLLALSVDNDFEVIKTECDSD